MEGIAPRSCPVNENRDDRKSAGLAARYGRPEPGTEVIDTFMFAREILRSPKVKQAGAGAEEVDVGNPEHVPVFYLDGDAHKRRRTAIKKFFTPKSVQTRLRPVMESTTDRLLRELQQSGQARLDDISIELAVTVASQIVGLTESNPTQMAKRIAVLLRTTFVNAKGLARLTKRAKETWYGYQFFRNDVNPSIKKRRNTPQDDIISQTLEKGYNERAIMIECMTYATAGMVTTREFIVMVAWHLFDRPDLKDQFLAADEVGQIKILQEILRLEPIAGFIYRRVDEDMPETLKGPLPRGKNYSIDMRAINTDESVVGACPFMVDPERAMKQNQTGTFMSFGDGSHHCPGWQVALNETQVFINRLFRVPGIRLQRAPDLLWNAPLQSYELRNAVVTCDRA